eukprot:gene11393-biopygen9032
MGITQRLRTGVPTAPWRGVVYPTSGKDVVPPSPSGCHLLRGATFSMGGGYYYYYDYYDYYDDDNDYDHSYECDYDYDYSCHDDGDDGDDGYEYDCYRRDAGLV